MRRVNHAQLQFHINDNYIVEIYVSIIYCLVIYDIDLALEIEKLVYIVSWCVNIPQLLNLYILSFSCVSIFSCLSIYIYIIYILLVLDNPI